MKLSQFERSWHGIDFSDLSVTLPPGSPANDAFYAAFYGELAKREISLHWLAEKHAVAAWAEEKILRRFEKPRILSIAVGLAVIEQDWLMHGYDVTLNECQSESLAAVRQRFPAAKTLIGNAFDVDIAGEYDLITIFTVDYALTDAQLDSMFRKVRGALAPGGMVLNQTVNTLTVRRMLAEAVKRWILRRYDAAGWVLWGWSRTPSAVAVSARGAGLRQTEQFLHDGGTFAPRSRLLWPLPPLRSANLVQLYESMGPAA